MATNSIKLFDDTVIKLSVNQGLEDQRSSEVLGNFTSGELAFTRDTGRLFVGDNSDGKGEHVGIQETIGGSLVGNKYLGLIDSKPLVVFKNNGEALSYEHETQYTGTQEYENFIEPGLFTEGSKFRMHSAEPKWDNWDRTATYNPKYNAYNGDFMYDLYQNALILFDTRISGEKNAASQPVIKMGDNNLPVTPETFIVDGKEIPSDSEEALTLTRRTQLKNYAKENDLITNSNMVYGDGYVILRMVEPDNQTVRFKTREFQENGLPVGENNYSHNILEVFHVPTEAMSGNFSDDFFTSGEIIYLHKDIKNVDSITGNGGKLRIPGKLCFSTPKDPRGATTFMEWDLIPPSGIVLPDDQNTKYRLTLTPYTQSQEDGKDFLAFQGNIEKIVPDSYTINLKGGLYSDQENPNTLVIDQRATEGDISLCPTLEFKSELEDVLYNEEYDPYISGTTTGRMFYTGNLGVDPQGRVRYIDTYDPTVLGSSFDRINKWEEINTSINFLKTPVTLAQSSAAKYLYSNPTEPTDQEYTIGNGESEPLLQATNGTEVINNDFRKLIKKVTSENTIIALPNKEAEPGPEEEAEVPAPEITNSVTFENNTLSITSVTTEGLGVAFSGNNLDTNTHVRSVNIEGTISGLDNKEGTCQVFAAVVDASDNSDVKILTVQQLKRKISNFSFNIFLDAHTVVRKDNVFVVMGILLDVTSDTISNIKVEYKTINLSQAKSLNEEQIFMLSDVGVNVNTDFDVSPYVFCTKKIVSCPNEKVLPKPENTNFPGTSGGSDYFKKIEEENSTYTYTKSWNNLFKVLGHNHYKDLSTADKSNVITTETSKYNTIGAAFKKFNEYEFDSTNNTIKNHTTIEENTQTQYMAWAWYKEYTKSTPEETETDITYYPHDEFEVREDIDENTIEYAKLSNGTYIFGGDGESADNKISSDIKEGEEEVVWEEDKRYRKLQCIFVEASCLENVTHIEYGSKEGIKALYDFKEEKGLRLANTVDVPTGTTKIILVNGSASTTKEIKNPKIQESISPDDNISKLYSESGSESGKISDYNYIVMVIDSDVVVGDDEESELPELDVEEEEEPDIEEGEILDDGDEPVDPASYYIYKIEKSCQYVTGYSEPSTLENVKIFVEDDSSESGGELKTGNLNESLIEDEKVYIPNTARNIILEITHVTTDNNTVAVFYANKFDDLAILHSGYKTKEWDDPAQFASDIILNPSYEQPFTDGAFTNGNGEYRLTLGKSISTEENNKFHSLDKVPNGECPSVFSAAPNEKCLFNSSVTETRVVEVPLHKIPGSNIGSDNRHFALRFANIRPSDENVLNQVVVRVIGYRV